MKKVWKEVNYSENFGSNKFKDFYEPKEYYGKVKIIL